MGDRVGGMKGLDMSTSRAPPALKCTLHASKALVKLTFGDKGELLLMEKPCQNDR